MNEYLQKILPTPKEVAEWLRYDLGPRIAVTPMAEELWSWMVNVAARNLGDSDTNVDTSDLITLTKAAEILGMSRPTVYDRIGRFQLHPVVIGRNRYLLRTEVEALRDNRNKGGGK